jgi:hypothetical protein
MPGSAEPRTGAQVPRGLKTALLGWRRLLLLAMAAGLLPAQVPAPRTSFRVSYVAQDAIYIDGGREQGLSEGLRLTVKRIKPGEPELAARLIGEVVVSAISANSAVCEVKTKEADFEVGDTAAIVAEDLEAVTASRAVKSARKYAQVIGFTEGDPLDEEMREAVPRPPLPEVNRTQGRISFEHSSIQDRAVAGALSYQEGLALRMDMTRIGGSYWNFTGYWRGRMSARRGSVQQETLTDLLNRTYHIGLHYTNPQSGNVAGVGRLLVPWASSLNTLDGGYYGRRVSKATTVGVFAGSTPDPTSWNYNPDRRMGGGLVNFDFGNFEKVRFSSTTGVALTRLGWKAEREFAFFENNLLFGRKLSIFHNLEADKLRAGRLGNTENQVVVSRSFGTVRLQPSKFISFDVNHNHFRQIPTFDLILTGTGLLDRFLFQGLSGGVRLELPGRISLYGNAGRSRPAGILEPPLRNHLRQRAGFPAGRAAILLQQQLRQRFLPLGFAHARGRPGVPAGTAGRAAGFSIRPYEPEQGVVGKRKCRLVPGTPFRPGRRRHLFPRSGAKV